MTAAAINAATTIVVELVKNRQIDGSVLNNGMKLLNL
jgi:hypothetical protein